MKTAIARIPFRPLSPHLAWVVAPIVAAAILLGPPSSAQAAAPDFNQDIRPILSRYCFKCHGPDDDARKAGMRLDRRETATKEAESGSVPIVPGRPDASELIARINSSDESVQMPPRSSNLSLTPQQKELLRQWIAAGAEYHPHWSFVAPKAPALPAVKQTSWPRNPIDRFVLAKLEAQGLAPSPQADRYALLRRAALDLTGIQPTPAEVDAVLKEASADGDHWDAAYEHYVDRLIASPQYGERWARRWLDLARYSDTNGYEKDRVRTIWPYRDWVIRALNDDMPFDRFSIEQIAGDMLPGASESQRVATGFHRNTMLNEEGGIDPLEYRFYAMTDRVGTTASTWLGLTMMCAQCHTHKYDPITHREYYQFMALMDNADEPAMDLPTPEIVAQRATRQKRIEQLTAELPEKYPVNESRWQPIVAAEVKSASGAKAEKLADGSWRFHGAAPQTDVYTLTFDTEDALGVDRLRLETIREKNIGPGRTPHGNFVLSEIKVTVTPRDVQAKPQPVAVTGATADFSQDRFPVERALGGDSKSGWAIDGPGGVRSRTATFFLDKAAIKRAVASADTNHAGKTGLRWTVTMAQNFGSRHTLGRFRLSLGTANDDPPETNRKEALEQGFAKWLDTARKNATHWTVLRPVEARANVPILTVQPDDSVFAGGDTSKNDKYHLKYRTNLRGITAVRLEVLPDDRLPKHGPGRIYYEGTPGNFLLTDLSLHSSGDKLPIARAVDSFHSGDFNAAKAVDDDLQSPWQIVGGQGRRHVAVFTLAKPLAVGEFDLDMNFEAYYACGLGRFRISVTTDAVANADERPEEVARLLNVADSALTVADRQRLQGQFLMEAPEMADARRELDQLIQSEPEYPTTLVMRERPPESPRQTFLHHRGEYLQAKDRVEPGVVSFLPNLPAGEPHNRLALARWLVARDNPLVARVTVNRQWAALFGIGIVRTTADFGSQGEPPTHPELLDWLAVRFMDEGWSMKKLHRLIVTSATYQQTSRVTPQLLEKDPENRLLARGPRFRLDAELIRDDVLRASGLLSSKMYGPSVFPPQLASITTEGAYGPMDWTVSQGEDRYRRSLYTFSKRTAPFASFTTFDAPTGEVCCPRRDMSNTPLQALTLLNSELYFEPAQAAARQLAADNRPIEAQLVDLFRRAVVRPPTTEEVAALAKFYDQQLARIKAGKLDAKKLAGNGPGDVAARAAWTLTARAVFNLDEMITKE